MMAVAVIGSNSLLLSPILADIAAEFSLSPVQVGWAITVYNGTTAVSALFLARLIDDWGVPKAFMMAYGGLLLGTCISAISRNLSWLIVGQGLAGLGAGVSLPAIYALAPMIAPKGQKSRFVGRVLTGWSVALVAGIPIAAFLSETVGWRYAYYLLVVFCALSLALIAFQRRNLPIFTDGQNNSGHGLRDIFGPFKVEGATTLLFMNLLFMAAFYGTYNYLGVHLRDAYELSATEAGYAVFAYGIGFGAASLVDSTIDRLGVRRTAFPVFALLAVIYLSLAFAYSSPLMVYCICVGWGFLNHLGLSAIITLLGETKTSIRGQLMGMNSVFTYLGGSLGTVFCGLLFVDFGFSWIALTAAGAIILLTFVFPFSARDVGKRRVP